MNQRKKNVMLSGLLVLALAAGCGSQPETNSGKNTPPSSSGQVAEAGVEEVYQQSCASCHGLSLEGGIGPSLEKVGSKLNEEQILEVITKGRGQMPSRLVSDDEAKKLAAWLAEKK
ncbi:cytochrome c551 [Staphylospora marina]|uniref:cytochrome c551 n=1 Tax=Staphylospora marina TaxID=2490858 RepID=UPI001F14CA5C|nr:cytochrome c [Staphylospora marina]